MIWEDDWFNKKSIIKSMLRYKLSSTDILHVYGRKTTIAKANPREAKLFYEKNHIQGGQGITGTTYKLIYNDEAIAMMTFNTTWRTQEGEWELTRFATKLNTSVVGGASKLLKPLKGAYA